MRSSSISPFRADAGALPDARVIAAPRTGSGKVALKLCSSDGSARVEMITRRQGDRYKAARRAEWGDSF